MALLNVGLTLQSNRAQRLVASQGILQPLFLGTCRLCWFAMIRSAPSPSQGYHGTLSAIIWRRLWRYLLSLDGMTAEADEGKEMENLTCRLA